MFDGKGNLAPGFHSWTVSEIEERLVAAFPTSGSRPPIFDGFKRLRSEMTSLGIKGEQWVDGSFSTAKSDPGDLDMLTIADMSLVDSLDAASGAIFKSLVDGPNTKPRFHCDSYFVPVLPVGHPDYEYFRQVRKYWYGEFALDRNDNPKGVIKLGLP